MPSKSKKSIAKEPLSTQSKNVSSKTPQTAPDSHQTITRAKSAPDSHSHSDTLQLQRTIGNRKVRSLLKTKKPIQTKLTVGPANDKYEQEADQTAKQVVKQISSLEPQQSRHPGQPIAQRQEIEDEELLQGKGAQPFDRLRVNRQPEEEEELLQGKSIQRQSEEDEELLQGKFETTDAQRQPEDEELLQGKFLQRQSEPEDEELMQGKFLQRQPEEDEELVQGKFETGQIRRQEEEEELMAKSATQNVGREGGNLDSETEASIQQARSGGQPLPRGLRRNMEYAMGADFRGARVHTDKRADALNQSLQAKAFTTGQDIFFKKSAYNPGSTSGTELIAHELTHVLQQRGDKSITDTVSKRNDFIHENRSYHSISRGVFNPWVHPKVRRNTDQKPNLKQKFKKRYEKFKKGKKHYPEKIKIWWEKLKWWEAAGWITTAILAVFAVIAGLSNIWWVSVASGIGIILIQALLEFFKGVEESHQGEKTDKKSTKKFEALEKRVQDLEKEKGDLKRNSEAEQEAEEQTKTTDLPQKQKEKRSNKVRNKVANALKLFGKKIGKREVIEKAEPIKNKLNQIINVLDSQKNKPPDVPSKGNKSPLSKKILIKKEKFRKFRERKKV